MIVLVPITEEMIELGTIEGMTEDRMIEETEKEIIAVVEEDIK
jgi:hypothetical protein